MKTIADPAVLDQLVERLERLRADTPRRWGTMSPGEMLCHLGDATDSILERDPDDRGRAMTEATRNRPFLKWIALRAPLPWPKGIKTPPEVDPHADGTKPADLGADRERVVRGLRALAAAPADALPERHLAFGRMSLRDWHVWAYRHVDHHLRQFGL